MRLELLIAMIPIKSLSDFNSIKVRLEQGSVSGSPIPPPRFQFHKGAIRTLGLFELCPNQPNFNSIKVRLELGYWL